MWPKSGVWKTTVLAEDMTSEILVQDNPREIRFFASSAYVVERLQSPLNKPALRWPVKDCVVCVDYLCFVAGQSDAIIQKQESTGCEIEDYTWTEVRVAAETVPSGFEKLQFFLRL